MHDNAESASPPDDPHVYVERVKWVQSGQTRRYFAAGCGCGWEADRFRVTAERTITDWLEHASQSDGSAP